MNEIAIKPAFIAGEIGLIVLILILTFYEIFHKIPLFSLGLSASFERRNKWAGLITIVGLIGIITMMILNRQQAPELVQSLLNSSFRIGNGIFIGKVALIAATALVVLLSYRYIYTQHIPATDYFLLLLFSLLGALVLISTENLLVLFLALEMMSIPIYALVGLHRYKSRAGESAIKYLLLGGFSSAFLLLGISFLYGLSGTLVISDILKYATSFAGLSETNLILLGLGFILIFVGLAFKVSLFPFHAWTPDVYEGASTPITAYMSVVIKLSAFAIILRLFANSAPFTVYDGIFSKIITVIALLTVIYGNSVALVQENVKRMLAYSSIAHAGYMALAIAPMQHSVLAVQAVLFYGIGYIAMNTLAFGVLVYLTNKDVYCEKLTDLRGVSKKYPAAAALMALAMFSLAGIPPAIGFAGKIQIFIQLVNAQMYWTLVIALLASLVALYFYLNVIVQMYMSEVDSPTVSDDKTGKLFSNISLWIAAAFILIFGIFPSPLMEWTLQWAKFIFQ
ncbi:NADH-quinone oxidoreductase subunit N [candidate division KSB1 bacterium]|nr:NADH-quinone oxidoreductase subunit N [candidate division KSB1 bacterium]